MRMRQVQPERPVPSHLGSPSGEAQVGAQQAENPQDLQKIVPCAGSADHEVGDPLRRRLGAYVELSSSDIRELESLTTNGRRFPAQTPLLHQSDVPESAVLVLDGFACRYKFLTNGRRQITAYLLPGDIFEPELDFRLPLDCALGTLTACRLTLIPRSDYEDLIRRRPRIALALQMARLTEAATLREWITNLGSRSGPERLAHFLCEILFRLRATGFASENQFSFPITQADLADTLGMSCVHVNRVLQKLRRDGLIELSGRKLTILKPDGLKSLAEFDASYLKVDATPLRPNSSARPAA
ncbi:Crp/Fnr family transcriptional regulator [Methylorubrum populi]|uniref:Crp/Fnr family transcriptional regulator n=1 Tax=Methylorubrum populi TaxID=223967 RepID=A0A169RJJ1_9HYPH|nr:Crp/Fnr family transcriptional regulator [Methylorubrum populi]